MTYDEVILKITQHKTVSLEPSLLRINALLRKLNNPHGAAPSGLNAIQQSAAACNANITGVIGAVQDTITAEAKGDLFANIQKVVTGQMTAAEAVESAMKLN